MNSPEVSLKGNFLMGLVLKAEFLNSLYETCVTLYNDMKDILLNLL